MSDTEKLDYRMLQKRDNDVNWNNSSLTPKDGELIIYKEDDDQGTPARIKIGDGIKQASELRGITGEVYSQLEEPKNAGEGAIWIQPTENLNGERIASKVYNTGSLEDWINELGFIPETNGSQLDLEKVQALIFRKIANYQQGDIVFIPQSIINFLNSGGE